MLDVKPAHMLSAEEKRDIVLALLAGNVGMAELCRRHQVGECQPFCV